jgi:hypothetical protein
MGLSAWLTLILPPVEAIRPDVTGSVSPVEIVPVIPLGWTGELLEEALALVGAGLLLGFEPP